MGFMRRPHNPGFAAVCALSRCVSSEQGSSISARLALMPLRFGSLFSGIEAASVAWGPLGWDCAWTAEVEPFPCAVLEHRHPTTPNLGDVTAPDFCARARNHGPVDLIAGGSPCQSFSVAGKRLGLEDPRGNLALHFFRVVHDLRPRWFVYENVPGLLSSGRGRDFGALLWIVGQLGYGWAYRVLDAQYFGVPQRRRRVFVIGYLGDWRPATAVLFEPQGLRRHSAPGRAAGQGVAACLTRRARSLRYDHTSQSLIATTLRARDGAKGVDSDCTDTLIAHTLRGDGFDASEDGTGRGTPLMCAALDASYGQTQGASNQDANHGCSLLIPIAFPARQDPITADVSLPLERQGGQAVAVSPRGRNGGGTAEMGGGVMPAMRACQGGGDKPHVMDRMQVRRLTPRECERLQGFPDDYTLIPNYRRKLKANEVLEVAAHLNLSLKEAKALGATPDGPRYKALGNSWAVPVVRWLGWRIELLERERAGRTEAA